MSNKDFHDKPDSRKWVPLTTLTGHLGGNWIKKRKGMSKCVSLGTKALRKGPGLFSAHPLLLPPHTLPHCPPRVAQGPGSMLLTAWRETLVSIQKGAPHSLCGKSSARKSFRQKWAPRRATPVGLRDQQLRVIVPSQIHPSVTVPHTPSFRASPHVGLIQTPHH